MGEPVIHARATSGPPPAPKPIGPWAAVNRLLEAIRGDLGELFRRIGVLESRPTPRDGTDGDPGSDGRGIAAARLVDGSLVIAYTDGTEANLGRVFVVGPAGNGIRDARIGGDGHLSLTLDDGRIIDAGLARGERGDPGEAIRGEPGLKGGNGRDATDEQVAAAVATYLGAHPPEKGVPGRDGADAPAVTDEQVAAAVARYLIANPPPAGKNGRDGADGKDGVSGRDVDQTQLAALENQAAALRRELEALHDRERADGDFQRRVEAALRVN